MREKERQRERETDRQTQRETDRLSIPKQHEFEIHVGQKKQNHYGLTNERTGRRTAQQTCTDTHSYTMHLHSKTMLTAVFWLIYDV